MTAAAVELTGVAKSFGRRPGLLDRLAGRRPPALRAGWEPVVSPPASAR